MKRALHILLLSAACFMPLPLHCEPYHPAPPPPPGPAERVGCYWMGGEEYCTRYCYWEVNGKRYCREKEFLAVPQGPMPEVALRPEQPPEVLYRPYK